MVKRISKARLNKINPDAVADEAEDYIEAYREFRKELEGITGLANPQRLKNLVKKIDQNAREVLRLEKKIDTIMERRARTACQLADLIDDNYSILREELEPEDYRDFTGR